MGPGGHRVEVALTPQQLYDTSVKRLSIVERLQLVKLVLDDLMHDPASWVIEENDAWSADDLADLTQASLAYVNSLEEPQQ
jgi:hypothetical protein